MGSWGRQFNRLVDSASTGGSGDASAEGMQVADLLRGLFRSTASQQGGVIYIPRRPMMLAAPGSVGAWFVFLDSDLVFPSNYELLFAPGAALIPIRAPGSTASLVFSGVLNAPAAPIFATSALASRWRGGTSYEVAPVRLTGVGLERVHPEWWGAAGVDAEVDTAALEAAIRAAHRDRYRVQGGETRRLKPLAVALRGRYRLSRPLQIVDGERGLLGPSGGFEMAGARDAVDAPNLIYEGAQAESMVRVEGISNVRLEGLRLDGRGRVARCLDLALTGTGERSEQHALVDCHFSGATETLLRVERRSGVGTMLIEGGSFRPDRRTMTAVELTRLTSVVTEFRGVTFVGDAAAMVHARATSFALTQCSFFNRTEPSQWGRQYDFSRWHLNGPEGGVDCYLDARADAPSSVSVMHCQSESAQFLVARGMSREAATDSTFMGFRHTLHARRTLDEPVKELGPWLRPRELEIPIGWEYRKPLKDVASQLAVASQKDPLPVSVQTALLQPMPDAKLGVQQPPLKGATEGPTITVSSTTAAAALTKTLQPGPAVPLPDPEGITPFGGTLDLQVPPVIDWSGDAQGEARLVLMGVRFLMSSDRRCRPVVGRNLRAPIVDLGVQWGNSRMSSPGLISAGPGDTRGGVVGTVPQTRTAHPWYPPP